MAKIIFGEKKSSFFTIILFFFLLFSSCKTTSFLNNEKSENRLVLPIEILTPDEFVWESLSDKNKKEFQSPPVFYTRRVIKEENAEWACAKIDLNDDWEFAVEPLQKNAGKKFSLQKFSKKYETVVAVNTVPFSSGGVPSGVVKINGDVIFPANPKYCALALKKVGADFSLSSDFKNQNSGDFEKPFVWRAKIFSSQNERDLADYDYAFGGFFEILNGEKIFEFKKYKASRTAVGLSGGGRFLYLFAARGINDFTGSRGLNFEECALILQKMGCESAMEFDGGRSSGLIICGKNFIKPFFQRKIVAAFGLKSKK